jgi:hypothetical protein
MQDENEFRKIVAIFLQIAVKISSQTAEETRKGSTLGMDFSPIAECPHNFQEFAQSAAQTVRPWPRQ